MTYMQQKRKAKNIVFCLISVYLLFVNCKDKSGINSLVKEWHTKTFILPDNSLRVNQKNNINPLSKQIKLVTMVNADCGRCILSLQQWKVFMSSIDTNKVGFIFILFSSDNFMTFNELGDSIINFNYPYYLDFDKKIFKKNKISDKKVFQTFLLDSLNHVLLIGDPIGNNDLSNLYQEEITRIISSKK